MKLSYKTRFESPSIDLLRSLKSAILQSSNDSDQELLRNCFNCVAKCHAGFDVVSNGKTVWYGDPLGWIDVEIIR